MRSFIAAIATIAFVGGTGPVVLLRAQHDLTVSVDPVVTGLNDPRGLTFGPNGHLYVAEAGDGSGTLSTIGQCDQVQPPVGPFVGGASARLLEFGPNGSSIVADGLPSTHASPAIGGDKQGLSAVTFVGNRLFALLTGAGCSHAHADANNGILSFNRDGVSILTDLSAWIRANPGAKGAEQPRNPDYEPDGTWYSMLFARGRIYAVEPNHGLLVTVHPTTGEIELVNDLFATFGDHTYTALAVDRGEIYIGTLGQIAFGPAGPPVPDFAHSFEAGIYKISADGAATQVASGLHAILGLAFDSKHRLYVLQSPIFVPGTGSLVRLDAEGNAETIVANLTFPSALTRGPDGAFYISVCGYHCSPGAGAVLRIVVPE